MNIHLRNITEYVLAVESGSLYSRVYCDRDQTYFAVLRSSRGIWEQGNESMFFRGNKEIKSLKKRETRDKCNFREQGTYEIKSLILANREQSNLFHGNKGTGTPLGGPHFLNLLLGFTVRSFIEYKMYFCILYHYFLFSLVWWRLLLLE